MHTAFWIAGVLLGGIWLSRLIETFHGMRKVEIISQPKWDGCPQPAPMVTVVVPAKDEEECIEQCLTSLLALDYPNYEVIAVNDRSTDRTGAIMERIASSPAGCRLEIIHVRELPPGWLGKTHAMWKAAARGTGEWILFTDGDIVFRHDALRRAVTYAEASKAGHLVLYPTVIMKSVGERMMISFFQILFIFGHRPWKVSDPNSRDHMGVGAFNFIRRGVYDKIGTYKALRNEVLDDVKLGKAVKDNGFAQRNVLGPGLLSLRWGTSAMGIVGNLTKNIFAFMNYRWPLSVVAAVALAFLSLGPFVGLALAPGFAKLGYAVAFGSLTILYAGMSRYSHVPAYYVVTYPASALLFIYTLLNSTWLALRNGGVTWRGTHYPLADLRANPARDSTDAN